MIEWGRELQDSVDYVIVRNYFPDGIPSAWENPKLEPAVRAFRDAFSPVEIRLDARRPDMQKLMRTMNVTLGDVGDRRTKLPELRAPDMTLRARTYRYRAYARRRFLARQTLVDGSSDQPSEAATPHFAVKVSK